MVETNSKTTAVESSGSSALLAEHSCEAEMRTIARMRGDGKPELSIGWKAADEIAALREELKVLKMRADSSDDEANTEMKAAISAENKVRHLREQIKYLEERKEGEYERMLEWRGIYAEQGDKPCPKCGGSGQTMYGSTTTWRGGCGGQAMTSDICDKCWGSGNAEKPWLNLRTLSR